ncbi:MAG: ribosome biogenesis GTPase Der [Alphaproteobacteria bacterium]|nr:ribosome biogenesis GTPase Der [Alphaproteobacteria bacterium]
MPARPFTVAIVGRPNVGKSTLFNRLVGRRAALVDKTPGLTRDRREGEAKLGPLRFRVFDTAGYEPGREGSIEARAWAQTEAALADADVALLVVDARAGVTPADQDFARVVRAARKPVVLVANKVEGKASDAGFYEGFSLGLGEPVAMSAEHGLGLADLHAALAPHVPHDPDAEKDPKQRRRRKKDATLPPADESPAAAGEAREETAPHGPLRLAIVGKPNVGKSTLVNRLVGEQRVITGPEPGLTRDAIAVAWEYEGQPVQLVDTAGMRRAQKVTGDLERLSSMDSRRAIGMSEVCVLVLDATEPMGRADLSAAAFAIDEGRAVVIALNKIDTVADPKAVLRALHDCLEDSLSQVQGVPVVPISALTGHGVPKLMPAVLKQYELWNTRIPTAPLNRWLEGILAANPPPVVNRRRIRIRYITQSSARPPTFVLFASRPGELADSYVRYAVNDLRARFRLPGVPIRMSVRKSARTNPYDKG